MCHRQRRTHLSDEGHVAILHHGSDHFLKVTVAQKSDLPDLNCHLPLKSEAGSIIRNDAARNGQIIRASDYWCLVMPASVPDMGRTAPLRREAPGRFRVPVPP